MNLVEILMIVVVHWIADFVFQTNEQGRDKGKNNWLLLQHVCYYMLVWVVVITLIILFSHGRNLLLCFFPFITFWLHLATDYFTSRLNRKLYNPDNQHNYFVAIGFDQLLHYVQLFTTYWLLTK